MRHEGRVLPVGDRLPQGLPVSVIHIGSLLQQLVELGEVSLQPIRDQYYSYQPIRALPVYTRPGTDHPSPLFRLD